MQVALCWMMHTLFCGHSKLCTTSNRAANVVAGTPVQNNMRELFGLMNLLDDEKYGDEEEFFERFGGDKEAISLEQVQALQVGHLICRSIGSISHEILHSFFR